MFAHFFVSHGMACVRAAAGQKLVVYLFYWQYLTVGRSVGRVAGRWASAERAYMCANDSHIHLDIAALGHSKNVACVACVCLYV